MAEPGSGPSRLRTRPGGEAPGDALRTASFPVLPWWTDGPPRSVAGCTGRSRVHPIDPPAVFRDNAGSACESWHVPARDCDGFEREWGLRANGPALWAASPR